MFTLKIHFTKHVAEKIGEPTRLEDEEITFIQADQVSTHGPISGDTWQEDFKQWNLDSYVNMLNVIYYNDMEVYVEYANGRLIEVTRGEERSWYLASRAWLLGPDGKTLERIAP